MLLALTLSGALFFVVMIIALIKRDNSLVDFIWGPSIALIGTGLLLSQIVSLAFVCIWAVVVLWAARLAFHIMARHNGEDPRYADLRTQWGSWWVIRSVFQVFVFQWMLTVIVASPLWALAYVDSQDSVLVGFLLAAAFVAFVLESIADYELQKFRLERTERSPKYYTEGLWSLVRHPNYLFESMFWLLIGASAWAATGNVLAMIGPVVVFILVRFISGVPIKERRASGIQWEAYKARTPKFFPIKKGKS